MQGKGRKGFVSLVVDISLAQVALIAAETAAIIRRFYSESRSMVRFANQVERFTAARADTLEARMCAADLLGTWAKLVDTPEHHALLEMHKQLRGRGRQDHVVKRLRQLAAAMDSAAQIASKPRARRVARRPSVA